MREKEKLKPLNTRYRLVHAGGVDYIYDSMTTGCIDNLPDACHELNFLDTKLTRPSEPTEPVEGEKELKNLLSAIKVPIRDFYLEDTVRRNRRNADKCKEEVENLENKIIKLFRQRQSTPCPESDIVFQTKEGEEKLRELLGKLTKGAYEGDCVQESEQQILQLFRTRGEG